MMKNEKKTKKQLIRELENLHRRVDKLEKAETEHQRAEEELKESEERFRKLIEQSPIVYEMYDIEGTQRMVNLAYGELWGIDPKSTVGTYNVWKTDQGEQLRPYLTRAYSGESLVLPDIHWDPKKEVGKGRERWISTIIYPLQNSHGEVENVVILHEDITSRKQTEYALCLSEEKLSKAFQASPDWISIST